MTHHDAHPADYKGQSHTDPMIDTIIPFTHEASHHALNHTLFFLTAHMVEKNTYITAQETRG
jgi:hypothetical protein